MSQWLHGIAIAVEGRQCWQRKPPFWLNVGCISIVKVLHKALEKPEHKRSQLQLFLNDLYHDFNFTIYRFRFPVGCHAAVYRGEEHRNTYSLIWKGVVEQYIQVETHHDQELGWVRTLEKWWKGIRKTAAKQMFVVRPTKWDTSTYRCQRVSAWWTRTKAKQNAKYRDSLACQPQARHSR